MPERIDMATHAEVMVRRNRISLALSKSMTKPSLISTSTGIDVKTVKNDLQWMRTNSRKWLSGWAMNGYMFATENTITQLEDIEQELQKKRSEWVKAHPVENEEYLKIIHELKDVINLRWVVQGDGPALMALKAESSEIGKNS